jgi:SAM-dependent methyltransferase
MTKDIESDIIDWWDSHPCELWHSNKPHHSLEFSKEISYWRDKHQGSVFEFVDRKKFAHKKVLEIGCGIGTHGLEFSKAGAHYVGVDVSSRSIDVARQRFKAENAAGQFYTLNAAKPDALADFGKFDIVFSCGVIHHWPTPEDFVPNFYDAMLPDGNLILAVYNEYSWKNCLVKSEIARFEAAAGVPCVKCFSREDISNMLSGFFHIDSIDLKGLFKYNVEKYKKGIFELEPWFAVMPEKLLQSIENHLGEMMIITARPKTQRDGFHA